MLVKKLSICHLKDVATLEKKVYPPELCLGYKNYVDNFNSTFDFHSTLIGNQSLGVFSNGELKAYMICYDKGSEYYISDLVCPNPKLLVPLLLVFCNNISNKKVKGEFRYTGYKMLLNIKKKFPNLLSIIKEEKVESYYYNGEDMYSVMFKIFSNEIECLEDKRYLILQLIHGATFCFQVRFKFVVDALYHTHNMTEKEIMTYKPFIMREIHNRNLDALRMLGDSFRFVVHYEGKFKYQKAYENMKKYLLENGYTEREKYSNDIETWQKKFSSFDWSRTISWTTVGKLDAKYKEDTISYYRSHVKRKFIHYYRKKKFIRSIEIVDKYEDTWLKIDLNKNVYYYIPRNFGNLFDAYLKELRFINDITEKIKESFGYCGYHSRCLLNSNGIPAIRKAVDEQTAYAYFDRIMNIARKNPSEKGSVFHDWGYIINEILAFEEYLTKGAFKHIFSNKSLNQINKIKSTLDGLNIDNKKYFDKKQLRKAISLAVRKDEDIAPIVSKAVQEAEERWLRNRNISRTVCEDMMAFIDRMKRYSPQVSANMLFKYFGQKTVKMVKGTYEGYFKEQTIAMDYQEFGQFIKDHLKGRTKKNKRLYGALNRISHIKDIFNGHITTEQFEKIIFELKQRNIDIPGDWMNLNKFYAKVEQKCSPEYLIAGNASVCCMSFGQEKAVTYAVEKGFGIINIYYKDRVIANSVIWVNEPYHCLVLDNIEVHPNYTKFNGILEKLFVKTVNQLLETYHLDYAVQGSNFNDLKLYDRGFKTVKFAKIQPVDVKVKKFYTDAASVFPLNVKISAKKALEKIKTVNALFSDGQETNADDEDVLDVLEDLLPFY